jgi:hypothetical protein
MKHLAKKRPPHQQHETSHQQEARSLRLNTLRHFGGSPKSRRICIDPSALPLTLGFFYLDDSVVDFFRRSLLHAVARFLLT